jgi:hypothetical protein
LFTKNREFWEKGAAKKKQNVEGTTVVPFEWIEISKKGTIGIYKGSSSVIEGTKIVTFKWTTIVRKGNNHRTKGMTVVLFEWTTTLRKGNANCTNGMTVVPFEWTKTSCKGNINRMKGTTIVAFEWTITKPFDLLSDCKPPVDILFLVNLGLISHQLNSFNIYG